MPDIRIAQEVPAVQIITPQEVLYRASITGKVCRATIVRDNGGDYLWVQGDDFGGDPRWIGRDDVLSYVLTPQMVSETAPETSKNGHSCDLAPEAPVQTTFVGIRHVDERFAVNRYRALLNEHYVEWQDEREWAGMQIASFGSVSQQAKERCQRYEARYRAVLKHVARARSLLTTRQLEWYQEEAHRLAAASFTHIRTDEQLIAEAV